MSPHVSVPDLHDKTAILVVDDEKHTREGLARALKGAYAVATAANGAEALEWLKRSTEKTGKHDE